MDNIRVVCFGEILWDNLKEGRRLGGAPLNVCYHLIKAGIPSAIVSQIGNDSNGKEILQQLEILGIDSSYCYTTKQYPTSTVEVISENGQDVVYEILEGVAWDAIETTSAMEQLVADAQAVVFGSLITRSETSRNTLLRLIPHSAFRVFDMNLRAPFYDKETIFMLMNQTNLLKLNESELEVVLEWLACAPSAFKDKLQTIQLHFPSISEIILTLGSEGSVYYSKDQYIEVSANKVQVKDTVGSGDSFLAGFLGSKLSGKSVEACLEYANLLSAFIASQHGACPVYTDEDLNSFEKSIQLPNYN